MLMPSQEALNFSGEVPSYFCIGKRKVDDPQGRLQEDRDGILESLIRRVGKTAE